MAGLDAGIPFATVAPQVQPSALAGIQPLRVGAPLQFQAMPAWQVPEAKPYVAQGIANAIESIGAGIKARYTAKKDASRLALEERKTALAESQQTEKERLAGIKETLDNKKLEEEKRHHDQMHQDTMARIDAVSSGKGKQYQQDVESVMGEDSETPMDSQSGNQEQTIQPSEPTPPAKVEATYTPPKTSAVESQGAALQGIAPLAAAPVEPEPIVTLNGASSGKPAISLSVAPIPVVKPADEASKKAGAFGDLPLPQPVVPKEKEEPKKDELPAIGTPAGDKDKSLVEAVKNPPALGILGEPAIDSGEPKPKSALSKVPAIQEVDQKDMRYRFGDRPDLANRQALLFNKKYPYATVQAEVKEPNKSVPYWHVDYKDVSKERRAELRTVEEHAASQGIKQQRLDLAREAKVASMAKSYESHPTAKLMDTRKDAMQRMLVAVQEDKEARHNNDKASLALIHQEMMDLFAQFASGKAPTEAQFGETKHAFSGLDGWSAISKKVQFWKSGAKLDERDVRTMQDLMLNTYNTSADQVNSQLQTIESILKNENPNISPMKLPVQYPLLKTRELLKEQLGGKDPEQALNEYSKLRGEYFDDATGTFKKPMPQDKREQFLKLKPIVEDYSTLKNNNFIPPNLDELKHPKKDVFGSQTYFKVPGFHSSYFSAPPASSLTTEGHYQGSGE